MRAIHLTPLRNVDTFPWPQSPTRGQIAEVAAAVALRALRCGVMAAHGWSLRDIYPTLDEPGDNPLRTAQARLDTTVRTAYGFAPKADPLAALLELNLACAQKESSGARKPAEGSPKSQRGGAGQKAGRPITPPALPPADGERKAFITDDCIRPNP